MTNEMRERRDYGFTVGLLTGTFVGAGLAIWFAPRLAAELRARMSVSANTVAQRAAAQYERASARVGEVVGDLTRTGQSVREDIADAVVSGAREVERFATAAKG